MSTGTGSIDAVGDGRLRCQRTYEKCVSVLRERNIASQTKSWSRLEIVNSD
jgi:hypothetical protein